MIQDPFTGRVWPTVPKQLRPADLEWNESGALLPLERTTAWERGEAPETYPFAV